MARSKWTLSIAGIVNIMVKTVNAVKEMDPMTAQYHNETVGDGKDAHVCGGRTGRTAFCKKCGKKELTGDMISTGGVLSKKQEEPVQFTEAERAGMLPKDIPLETLQVVNFIEPLPYWYLKGDHQFVIAQNAPSLGSLAMLYDALARTKKVALIRSWDSGNEYYSVLTHEGIMTSCYFGAEITKANEELDKVKAATVDAKVSTLMTQLVKKNIKADFKVDTLHNTFKETFAAMVQEKMDTGHITVVAGTAAPMPTAQDNLMATISAALALGGGAPDEETSQPDASQATGTHGVTVPVPAPAKAKKSAKK